MESVERLFVVAWIENAVGEESVDFVRVFRRQRMLHAPWAGVLPKNLMGWVRNSLRAEEKLRTKELDVILD